MKKHLSPLRRHEMTGLMNAQELNALDPLAKPKLPRVKRKRTFVRLPEPVKEALEQEAAASTPPTSLNALVIHACVDFLRRKKR